MKNLFLTIAVFGCTFFFAQKSETYLQISYNSICCGTPSTEPVMKYIENFPCQKKKKNIEIFRQRGLGREGEFNLYIGIDALSKSKKKKFITGLDSVIKEQNNLRKQNSDGIVNFTAEETVKKETLNQINNLTIYKKENLK